MSKLKFKHEAKYNLNLPTSNHIWFGKKMSSIVLDKMKTLLNGGYLIDELKIKKDRETTKYVCTISVVRRDKIKRNKIKSNAFINGIKENKDLCKFQKDIMRVKEVPEVSKPKTVLRKIGIK